MGEIIFNKFLLRDFKCSARWGFQEVTVVFQCFLNPLAMEVSLQEASLGTRDLQNIPWEIQFQRMLIKT